MAPLKYHGSHGPGMLLEKLLGPLKLLEFVEVVLEFLLKTPSILETAKKISSFCLKQQLAFSIRTIQCFLSKLSK